ncbi:TPA: hypothetical protein SLV24_001449 [Pseudomonas aeruginosa]|nr:hypothetical protein [Pseudomonas aeruginosa]MBG7505892.1 hypothetical protein [Pseudomonas aeruginosa]MBI7355645.1 hypothetical protein [Pseudomonas aeruginosa]MBI8949331.1 hypothetical protein [Pseudomonas aeruginosa]MWW04610.1 hypothetical protein [Pseudomonas aeruginosa]
MKMAVDPKRNARVEHALASIRLSGCRPSVILLELSDQYRSGALSASEMVEKLKQHHQPSKP